MRRGAAHHVDAEVPFAVFSTITDVCDNRTIWEHHGTARVALHGIARLDLFPAVPHGIRES